MAEGIRTTRQNRCVFFLCGLAGWRNDRVLRFEVFQFLKKVLDLGFTGFILSFHLLELGLQIVDLRLSGLVLRLQFADFALKFRNLRFIQFLLGLQFTNSLL